MDNKNDIEEIVYQFCECCENGPTRYRSWIWCYEKFKENFIGENKEKINDDTYDYLALNLAFYLASWGMYRGSSLILQFDYKIYIGLIKKLPANLSLDEIGDIAETFSKILKYFERKKGEYKNKYSLPNPTATLATKILMGIYGITPAFDRFFVDGVKSTLKNDALKEIKPTWLNSKNPKNFENVIVALKEFINNNKIKEQTRKLNKENSDQMQDYQLPPMKIVDMYFWQLGYNAQIPKIEEKIRTLEANILAVTDKEESKRTARQIKYQKSKLQKLKAYGGELE